MLCREGFNERYSIKAKRENKASVGSLSSFREFSNRKQWYSLRGRDIRTMRFFNVTRFSFRQFLNSTSPWKLVVLKNNYFSRTSHVWHKRDLSTVDCLANFLRISMDRACGMKSSGKSSFTSMKHFIRTEKFVIRMIFFSFFIWSSLFHAYR